MAAPNSYSELIRDGLWNNNQALVALLGLCPLLAVTSTAINGLGLGLATTAVLVASNGTVSLIRNQELQGVGTRVGNGRLEGLEIASAVVKPGPLRLHRSPTGHFVSDSVGRDIWVG